MSDNSLDFGLGDIEALEALCVTARKRAKNNPCIAQFDAQDAKYSHRFGPWNLHLTLDWSTAKRKWHGSAAKLSVIGYVPVQFPSGLVAQMPQEAMLSTRSWDDDEKKQADYLLGKLMAPFIIGDTQQILVSDGVFAKHWETEQHN